MAEKTTKVDCYELWEAGTQFVPELCAIYGNIAATIGAPPDNEEYRFNQKNASSTGSGHESNPDGWYLTNESSPVYAAFQALRDEVQVLIANTITNLTDIGTALEIAGWAYAEQDGHTEEMIQTISDNYNIPEDSIEIVTEPEEDQ